MLTLELAQTVLDTQLDPNTGKPYNAYKGVKNLTVDGAVVSLDVTLGYPAQSQFAAIRTQLQTALTS